MNYLQSYCAARFRAQKANMSWQKRHDANGSTRPMIFHPLSRTPGQSCAMLCFGLADLDYRDSTDFDLLAFVESGTCSSSRQRTNRNPIQNQIDSHHS